MKKILNIVLAVLMVISVVLTLCAIIAGGSDASISANLIWTYILAVVAVGAILYSTVMSMLASPAGLKKTLISAGIIVAVVGVALIVALSHKGLAIPNSAGGVFDNYAELVVTEAGIIVTYIVAAAAIAVALYSEVRNVIK